MFIDRTSMGIRASSCCSQAAPFVFADDDHHGVAFSIAVVTVAAAAEL
jgi:hypothetical protein